MKNMKEWTKKTKWVLGITTLFVIGGCSVGYKVYADSIKAKNIEEMKAKVEAENQKIDRINSEIQKMYSNHEKGFLIENVSTESIKEIENQIKSLNTITLTTKDKNLEVNIKSQDESIKDLENNYKLLNFQVEVQNRVNDLFNNDAINGGTVKKDLAISDNCNRESIEKIFFDTKTLDGTFLKDSEWTKAIKGLKEAALEQLKQIEVATQKANALFDKENVKGDVSQDAYNQAKGEVDKIKNEKAKKSLTDRLAKVAKKLEEKAQAEKEKQKAEAEAQATASGGTVVENADGSYSVKANNSGVSGTNSGGYSYSGGSSSNGSSGNGGYTGNNGASSSTGGSSSNSGNSGGNTWSGNQDSGGSTAGGVGSDSTATGNGGTWTGGTFNPGDIDTSGWN